MSEWMPIESAPKDGTAFLALCEDECTTRNHWIACWEGDAFVVYDDAEGVSNRIVVCCLGYWMPLPPAPPAAMKDGGDARLEAQRAHDAGRRG